jgi:predicted Zn-dependent protease
MVVDDPLPPMFAFLRAIPMPTSGTPRPRDRLASARGSPEPRGSFPSYCRPAGGRKQPGPPPGSNDRQLHRDKRLAPDRCGGEHRDETAAGRWERAQLLFDAKDYISAAKLLTLVVGEVPEQTGPRLLLARAYFHSAQPRRAEEELREVVNRDPVEHYAHLLLGRTLERQSRHDEAAPWLRMAAAFAGEPVAGR